MDECLPKCPLCGMAVPGGLYHVSGHIFSSHGIRVSHRTNNDFTCHEEGCCSRFQLFRSWLRHMHEHGYGDEDKDVGSNLQVGDPQRFPHTHNAGVEGLANADTDGSICMDIDAAEESDDSSSQENPSDSSDKNDSSESSCDENCTEICELAPHRQQSSSQDEPIRSGNADSSGDAEIFENSGNAEDMEASIPASGNPDPRDSPGDSDSSSDSGRGAGGSNGGGFYPSDSNTNDSDPGDGGGSSGGESGDDEADGMDNIMAAAATLIASLRAIPTTTRSCVTRAITGCESITRDYTAVLRRHVHEFLDSRNLLNERDSIQLLQRLQFVSPFRRMKSKEGQLSAIKKHYRFISPRSIFLGHRIEQVQVGDGQYQQRPVRENFQYVPIKEILKLVLGKAEVRQYMAALQPQEPEVLTCYTDGNQFRNHPFFQRHPSAFQLLLYFDDVEVCNVLGSRSGVHNLGVFYVQVLNVPQYLNSLLDCIHVLALANYQDIRDRGFRVFLQPFIDDLLELESDEGSRVFINGEEYTLRATLAAFTGDSKAAHEVLGFIRGRANHFCRTCTISRDQLHEGVVLFGEMRTREVHDNHLAIIAADPVNGPTQTGVTSDCPLHDSQYFHASKNKVFDPMHDLGEGVIGMIVLLLLWHFITVRRYFNVWDINRRIYQFNYGRSDRCNKPSPNFTDEKIESAETNHKTKQSSAQTFCLLRALPFLLDRLGIPDDCPHMELLSLLRRIVDIALAPRLRTTMMPYFRRILQDFRTLYRELFPQVHEINKMHHIQHYPECIEEVGPLRQFHCMRPEGKNHPVKSHVVSCRNYRNVPYTAVQHAQIRQAMTWGTDSDNIEVTGVTSGVMHRDVNELPTRNLLRQVGVEGMVETAKSAEHRGTLYSIGDFIITRSAPTNANGLHSFGTIQGIIIRPGVLWLEVKEWTTVAYDEAFSAYHVEDIAGGPVHLLHVHDLPLHPPLSGWTNYTNDNVYLSLKHFVL